MKNALGILKMITLNLQIVLSSMDFLTIFTFLIHEHKYPFIDFCLLSFFCLYLLVYSVQIFHLLSFLFLDILSDANRNGIGFFTSLSYSLVLVYRNTTNLGTLILYPSALLNSFISSKNFCRIQGFLLCHLGIDSFTPSFTIWMSFIHFSFLISLARISSTMLKKSGEGGQPSLNPILLKLKFCPTLFHLIVRLTL